MRNEINADLTARIKQIVEPLGWELFVDMGPQPDWANREQPFVYVQIDFDSVKQTDLGSKHKRYEGYAVVSAFQKDVGNPGVRRVNTLFSELDERLSCQIVGTVEVQEGIDMKPRKVAGWLGTGMQYFFWGDKLS